MNGDVLERDRSQLSAAGNASIQPVTERIDLRIGE